MKNLFCQTLSIIITNSHINLCKYIRKKYKNEELRNKLKVVVTSGI